MYTVRAEDAAGNVTVKYLYVTNIDSGIATAPKVDSLTNLMTQVTGKASAGAEIEVVTPREVCTGTADESGYYAVDVSYLNADDTVLVKQTDADGRESSYTVVTVKRAAANAAVIKNIKNTQKAIKGTLEDSVYCKVVAICDGNVYIPYGQKSIYKKTSIYEAYPNKNIVETTYTFDPDTNSFTLVIPNLMTGQTIKVFSYDWRKRASNVKKYTVKEYAPNKPVLNKIVADEKMVYGYVPGQTEECTVVVRDRGKVYKGTTDSTGDKVRVRATDKSSSGKTRKSLLVSKEAVACESMSKVSTSSISIDDINSKDTVINGEVDIEEGGSVSVMAGGLTYHPSVGDSGEFSIGISKTLSVGSRICVILRDASGDVQAYNYRKVKLAKPDSPLFVTKKITENTTEITIKCSDSAKAILVVGDKTYRKSTVEKKGRMYRYTFTVENLEAGKKVYAYMKNSAGSSKKTVFGKVKKGKKEKKDKSEETE